MGKSGKSPARSNKSQKSGKSPKTPETPKKLTTAMRTAYTPGGLCCVTANSLRSSGRSTKTTKSTKTPAAGPLGRPKNGTKSDRVCETTVDAIFRDASQSCDRVLSNVEKSLHTTMSSTPKKTPNSKFSTRSTVSPVTAKTPTVVRSNVDTPRSSRIVRPCMHRAATNSPAPKTATTTPTSDLTLAPVSQAEKTVKESRLNERTLGALKQGNFFGKSGVPRRSTKVSKSTPSKMKKISVSFSPVHTAVAPPNTPIRVKTPVNTALSPSWIACHRARTTDSASAEPRSARSSLSGGLTLPDPPSLDPHYDCHMVMDDISQQNVGYRTEVMSLRKKNDRLKAENDRLKLVVLTAANTATTLRSLKTPRSTRKPSSSTVSQASLRRFKKATKSIASKKSTKSDKSKKNVSWGSGKGKSKKMKSILKSAGSGSRKKKTAPRTAKSAKKQKNEEMTVTATSPDGGLTVVVRIGISVAAGGQAEEPLKTKKLVVKEKQVYGG